MAYYGLVFRRAARNTSFFDAGKIVGSVVVSLVALALQWQIGVRPLPVTLQIMVTVVAAYVVVALITFAVNFLATPARLHLEQEAKIRALEGDVARHEDAGGKARRSLAPLVKRLSEMAVALPVPIRLGPLIYGKSPWTLSESDLDSLQTRASAVPGANLEAAFTAVSAIRYINGVVDEIKREEKGRGWNPNTLNPDVWARNVADARNALAELSLSITDRESVPSLRRS
jgi:hypothetical protein